MPNPTPFPLTVSADDEGTPFEAHSLSPHRWNGWECPLFTTEQGKAIATRYPDAVTYNEATDTFTETFGDDEAQPTTTLDVEGVRLHIIGDGWTWQTTAHPHAAAVEYAAEEALDNSDEESLTPAQVADYIRSWAPEYAAYATEIEAEEPDLAKSIRAVLDTPAPAPLYQVRVNGKKRGKPTDRNTAERDANGYNANQPDASVTVRPVA